MKDFLQKAINRGKWHLKELSKTLSKQPSFYCSKRIERLILFNNAIILLDFFFVKQYKDLTTTEAIAIFTAQMLYAGYQIKQIQKDKQIDAKMKNNEHNG